MSIDHVIMQGSDLHQTAGGLRSLEARSLEVTSLGVTNLDKPSCRAHFPLAAALLSMTIFLTGSAALAQSANPPVDAAAQVSAQVSGQVSGQTAEKIDSAVREVLDSTGVPSASIAIVENGHIAYLHAYGEARLSPPTPAQPEMRYSIGSISKQFTVAAVLLLAEEGKLQLDDPVAKYLPDLTRAREVTLRMLLSHTSGYQDFWPQDYVMISMMAPTTAAHILEVWGKKPLDFDPGTKWQYSNTNFVIAGKIVEQVSGMPLIQFLESRVFAPLGMRDVYDSDARTLPPTDPLGYYRHALGPLRPAPQEGAGWMFAAGELAMPARDLALWDISLIDHSLLKPASYAEMFQPVLLKSGASTGYGLGLFIRSRDGHAMLEHSGEVSGFVSENIVFPAEHAAIAVLTNEDASSAAAAIGRALTPLVLGTAPGGPQPEEVAQAETRARAIFIGLEKGQLDRTQLTENLNAYFTPEAMSDFANSLAPLGAPLSFTQAQQEGRGGMIFRVFTAQFANRKLTVTTYEMPDGKLEQYLVMP
jgi:D-alanyl-D-alanine carboxypeptidase